MRKREKAIHEYIIGRQKKYYESVVIIFDYINSLETFTPCYSNLTSMFNVFKENLRICLKESKQLFKNDK